MMGDGVKVILAKPIQLAELKAKTVRHVVLIRQAARADLYERLTRRIMDNTEQVLDKALTMISSRPSLMTDLRIVGRMERLTSYLV